MEKSKSFSGYYSTPYTEARFGFEDRSKAYSFNGPVSKVEGLSSATGSGNGTSSSNPEVERRKRVANYNMYSAEGKFKSSLRNSFKWIKGKFVDNFYDNE